MKLFLYKKFHRGFEYSAKIIPGTVKSSFLKSTMKLIQRAEIPKSLVLQSFM